MNPNITDSVARLYRAGSEHSQSAEKLRDAANKLLQWIKDNVPDGFTLPLGCKIYPSGEFTRVIEAPIGSCPAFKITLGERHTRESLFRFSKLIADGFIDELAQSLSDEAKNFAQSAQKITKLVGE